MEFQPQGTYLFIPLYGFGSDAEVIEFSQGIQICKYDSEKLDLLVEHYDTFRDYLKLYPTD
jgi:hypothetical protein